MKKLRALVTMLAAVAFLALLPNGGALTAQAEEPTTYSVKYVGGDVNDWRFVKGSSFDTIENPRELYYLRERLKDGDLLVIYSGDNDTVKELDLGDVQLSNLTIHNNALVAVMTGGIQDCYVLAGAAASVHGDVINAYLYDKVVCSFQNNVLEMVLYFDEQFSSSLSVAGTVGHFHLEDPKRGNIYLEMYDIPAKTFAMKDGANQTPYDLVSLTPTEDYEKALAEAAGASPDREPASSSDDSDEYDEVPKTGDSGVWIWLLCASIVCFGASLILRRPAGQSSNS